MNSKKLISLFVLLVVVSTLIICAAYILNQKYTNSYTDSSGKYKTHVSYSLEDGSFSFDNGPIEYRTKLSFIATISGTKEDIENIETIAMRINMDYFDLVLEHGFYVDGNDRSGNGLLSHNRQIKGYASFDTKGMVEEGVSATDLLKGIEIYDKDGNAFMLYFNF